MIESLELHLIQRSFRAVMEAMARPGKVFVMARREEPSLLPGFDAYHALGIKIFLDQAVSFSIVGDENDQLRKTIRGFTHAQHNSFDRAEFIIIPEGAADEEVATAFSEASGGTLIAPENGTLFLIGCERLAVCKDQQVQNCSDTSLYWVSVEGPGVQEAHVFGVSCDTWIWARNRRVDEFPCGIDIILFDEAGQVVAIPRTSFISLLAVKGEAEPWAM